MAQPQEIISDPNSSIPHIQLAKSAEITRIFEEISRISYKIRGLRLPAQNSHYFVSKSGFTQYFKLPRIVGIRLFEAVNSKRSWDFVEFVGFCELMRTGQLSQQIALVFAMLDFNGDGYITRQDCYLMLCHTIGFPVNKTFEQILASQNDIGEILDAIFKKPGQKLSFFEYRVSQQSSDHQLQNGIYEFICSRIGFILQASKEEEKMPQIPDQSPISNGGEILEWPLALKKASEPASPPMEKAFDMQGPMYRLYSDVGLKAYHYILKGNELYVYRKESDAEHKYIIELKPGQELVTCKTGIQSLKGESFYKFSLFDGDKARDFFHLKLDMYLAWKDAIESVIHVPKAVEQQYSLGEVIRTGKKSNVQLATHRKTNKLVVVKTVFKKGLSEDELEAIRNEIQVSKISNHPSLLKLLDVFEDESNVYLVLEHMPGGNLYTYLIKLGNLNASVVKGILIQLASALYYLHNFNIVHRDLKPDNILLTGKTIKMKGVNGKDDVQVPEIKLADFGLSVSLLRNEKLSQPYGTMMYAAPEILKDNPYDEKIDMYSLGVTLYMLLCGRVPFQNSEVDLLLEQVEV